ncbi:hypothetical protein PA598K_02617 [Paenibacillus sp. 598K]|uniref:MerR family transcriptional regulator n=1 Tax=Paenibacillus sp. 598K TaxID=1117987 RepID=UPI000FFA0E8E|nr:MerR family transcriptional regulator [Paenibacillus sp. 598K]GBF74281.1 hypothetical protein PA598K_02617 [Paenibacillus sp. 598K]
MKMKEVCQKTALTERTIRYYVERQLIAPASEEINGRTYLSFAEEDVEQLLAIAELRKVGFGIEDIIRMQQSPAEIGPILASRREELLGEVEAKQEILQAIEAALAMPISSTRQLAAQLTEVAGQYSLPPGDLAPNFARFDPETKEEKEEAYLDFKVSQRLRDRREAWLGPLLRIVGRIAAVAAVVAALVYIVVAISGIPRDVDLSYTAMQLRMGQTETAVPVQVRIEGKWRNRLFSEPTFSGRVMIEGFEYTQTDELIDIRFYPDVRNGYGQLTYTSYRDGMVQMKTLGAIWQSDRMSEIAIWVFEPLDADSKRSTDLVIAGPASTGAAAAEIVERLSDYVEQLPSEVD